MNCLNMINVFKSSIAFFGVHERSFRYASPCLGNQLPLSLRQPHSGSLPVPVPLIPNSPIHLPITLFYLFWFATLLIHNSLCFTPALKPTCFTNPTPPRNFTCSSRIVFTDFCPHRFFWATRFLFYFSYFFRFCLLRYTKLAISTAFERT